MSIKRILCIAFAVMLPLTLCTPALAMVHTDKIETAKAQPPDFRMNSVDVAALCDPAPEVTVSGQLVRSRMTLMSSSGKHFTVTTVPFHRRC